MKIDTVTLNTLKPLQPPSWAKSGQDSASAADNSKSFSSYLKAALNEVNQWQEEAGQSALNLATGGEADVHQTMIAYEKAALALQLTIEVRNKLIEAYQEIMRMQM